MRCRPGSGNSSSTGFGCVCVREVHSVHGPSSGWEILGCEPAVANVCKGYAESDFYSVSLYLLNLFFLSNKTILRVDFLNAESQNRKRLSSFG